MLLTKSILKELKALGDAKNLEGMKRFGIEVEQGYGVAIPKLRLLSKRYGKNHELALALWDTKIHDARLLATMIDDPSMVTQAQMEQWVQDFNSWDICDQCCGNLFDRTSFATLMALTWSQREETFVKRAGFVLMATMAVHKKREPDETFLEFLELIEAGSDDERNFVKKAVNWALRQIGKRNYFLYKNAYGAATRISKRLSKAAKWIAADALREFNNEMIVARTKNK